MELICDLLTEYYHFEGFKTFGNSGPLWRIDFIEYEYIKEKEEFEYEVIMLYHHALADGTSSYESFLKLFYLIEKLYVQSEEFVQVLRPVNLRAPSEQLFNKRTFFKHTLDYPDIFCPGFVIESRPTEPKIGENASLD
jgi:hypothetical protein